jgi:hypothetical protein
MYIPADAFGGATPERTAALQMKCDDATPSSRLSSQTRLRRSTALTTRLRL